ncbi:MAG: alpha/beta hydrolase [Anaerolineales bacterium]|nr:alpha/beta hydrolase [Anaerolineales bacterium]
MSVLILQNEIVHYEVLGRGKPLLFLHGWVGSWRYWMPAMQAASISFRTYALDLWGFGDTAKAPAYYSLENQVNMIDLFMQEMGIAKIAIIGHGLGAIVGAKYAMQYPKWVDRLLAVGLPDGAQSLSQRLFTSQPAELADWLLTRKPDNEAARAEAPKADARAIQRSLSIFQDLSGAHTCVICSRPA